MEVGVLARVGYPGKLAGSSEVRALPSSADLSKYPVIGISWDCGLSACGHTTLTAPQGCGSCKLVLRMSEALK